MTATDRGAGREDGEAALERLRRFGGEALARDMVAIFRADAPERVAAARQALAAGDVEALTRAVHSLRSTCAQMGAVTAERLCRELEHGGLPREPARIAAVLDRLAHECAEHGAWMDAALRPAAAASPAGRRRASIALVEDNPDNRLLVQAILGDVYEVREYATGTEALEAFGTSRPDMVLLDISLPGLSGHEVLARIRSDARLARLPLVALTAHAMSGEREAFLAAGFDGYVAKPIVDEAVLLRAVADALALATR